MLQSLAPTYSPPSGQNQAAKFAAGIARLDREKERLSAVSTSTRIANWEQENALEQGRDRPIRPKPHAGSGLDSMSGLLAAVQESNRLTADMVNDYQMEKAQRQRDTGAAAATPVSMPIRLQYSLLSIAIQHLGAESSRKHTSRRRQTGDSHHPRQNISPAPGPPARASTFPVQPQSQGRHGYANENMQASYAYASPAQPIDGYYRGQDYLPQGYGMHPYGRAQGM